MTTAPEQIEQRFLAGGWAYVESAPAKKLLETPHLDFKEKESAGTGKPSKADKRTLAKAVSGFANADGGVVVWGVRAKRPKGEEFDRAVSVHPISGVTAFISALNELGAQLVDPPVTGLRHEAITDPRDPDRGFVLTVVPQSESPPHRADVPGQHGFYRRVGSSFVLMRTYEIRDLLGRRPQPRIRAYHSWTGGLSGYTRASGVASIDLEFFLENVSSVLVRFPCLTLSSPSDGWRARPHEGAPLRASHGFLRRRIPPDGWWQRLAGAADEVLYPGDRVSVARVTFPMSLDRSYPEFKLTYAAVAEGCGEEVGEVLIGADELETLRQEALERWNQKLAQKRGGG